MAPKSKNLARIMNGNSNYQSTQYAKTYSEGARHATLYTYLHGGNRTTLNIQGPHTIAHKFLTNYLRDYCWDDIFRESVTKPDIVRKIIQGEFHKLGIKIQYPETGGVIVESGFKEDKNKLDFCNNLNNYLNDYTEDYNLLEELCKNGMLKACDLGTIPDTDPRYKDAEILLSGLMEMNPFGTYAWNRHPESEYCFAAAEETAGKGELSIHDDSTVSSSDLFEVVVDFYGKYNDKVNMSAYLNRIHTITGYDQKKVCDEYKVNHEDRIEKVCDSVKKVINDALNGVPDYYKICLQPYAHANVENLFNCLISTVEYSVEKGNFKDDPALLRQCINRCEVYDFFKENYRNEIFGLGYLCNYIKFKDIRLPKGRDKDKFLSFKKLFDQDREYFHFDRNVSFSFLERYNEKSMVEQRQNFESRDSLVGPQIQNESPHPGRRISYKDLMMKENITPKTALHKRPERTASPSHTKPKQMGLRK